MPPRPAHPAAQLVEVARAHPGRPRLEPALGERRRSGSTRDLLPVDHPVDQPRGATEAVRRRRTRGPAPARSGAAGEPVRLQRLLVGAERARRSRRRRRRRPSAAPGRRSPSRRGRPPRRHATRSSRARGRRGVTTVAPGAGGNAHSAPSGGSKPSVASWMRRSSRGRRARSPSRRTGGATPRARVARRSRSAPRPRRGCRPARGRSPGPASRRWVEQRVDGRRPRPRRPQHQVVDDGHVAVDEPPGASSPWIASPWPRNCGQPRPERSAQPVVERAVLVPAAGQRAGAPLGPDVDEAGPLGQPPGRSVAAAT